ncbi:MAG: HAD hydrolase family protein [Candidatus Rokubacteria bacterium]|nr:HAD hydrolase family protein [Candidatus Rokubacteria bacterium]
MIFRALACDYDGTLASEDRLGPEALAALRRAREAGLRLILVTSRNTPMRRCVRSTPSCSARRTDAWWRRRTA